MTVTLVLGILIALLLFATAGAIRYRRRPQPDRLTYDGCEACGDAVETWQQRCAASLEASRKRRAG